MQQHFRYWLGLAGILGLWGCGGGGGGESPPIPDASVGGIWEGTITFEGGEVRGLSGLVTEDGVLQFIQEDGAQYWGIVSSSQREITGTLSGATPLGATFADGSVSGSGNFSGNVIPRASFDATSTFTTANGAVVTGDIALNFQTFYGRNSSLGQIAGNYTSAFAPGTDTLTIDGEGVLFGQIPATSCVLNGRVRVIDPAYNVYGIIFTYDNCTGESSVLNGSAFNGYVTLDNRSPPESIVGGLHGTPGGRPTAVTFVYERI
ncbi:MAG: hypothetical protein P8080_05815 [Gammaproteobacteria bacterium]